MRRKLLRLLADAAETLRSIAQADEAVRTERY